jgi:hypothetical protein
LLALLSTQGHLSQLPDVVGLAIQLDQGRIQVQIELASWAREEFKYKKSQLADPRGSQVQVQAVEEAISSDCNMLWLEVRQIQFPIQIHVLLVTLPFAM